MARATAWIFERNGNAVAALLLAIAGLIGFGLVLGLLARSQIAATGRPGIRLASAGIALGVVAFVLPIVRVST